MGKVRLNRKGFREIRSAPRLVAKIDKITSGIADRANQNLDEPGYLTSSVEGAARPQGRHRGTVITARFINSMQYKGSMEWAQHRSR